MNEGLLKSDSNSQEKLLQMNGGHFFYQIESNGKIGEKNVLLIVNIEVTTKRVKTIT